ncbi:MAG TPA: hypothetical protein VFG43_05285 [Geminicoccaceae bacterium]|nr:hypothetical protein [Geminicoccaceae bacterium]
MLETVKSKWETAKPMVIGLAIGLVAGPVISGFAGWQVTSSAAQAQVHSAVVEQQAAYCDALARAEVQEPGKLERTARSDLAKKWAIMPGATVASSEVVGACGRKLAI